MNDQQNKQKERSFILVGPDGQSLHLAQEYQNPAQWKTVETEDAVMLMARPQTRPRRQALLERITEYVDLHLGEKVTLRDVAAHCGVSVSTITQMFQKKTDVTFHTYLTRRRMAAAQHLIRQGDSMEAVQKQVGFGDYSSFYRAFKQVYGISPREFKKNMER